MLHIFSQQIEKSTKRSRPRLACRAPFGPRDIAPSRTVGLEAYSFSSGCMIFSAENYRQPFQVLLDQRISKDQTLLALGLNLL